MGEGFASRGSGRKRKEGDGMRNLYNKISFLLRKEKYVGSRSNVGLVVFGLGENGAMFFFSFFCVFL